jgi:hypothetical protein
VWGFYGHFLFLGAIDVGILWPFGIYFPEKNLATLVVSVLP